MRITKNKLWYHGWRLAIIATLVLWLCTEIPNVEQTTKAILRLIFNFIVIAGIAYKLYTNEFRLVTPRQFIDKMCMGRSKLVACAIWIFPMLLCFAITLCIIYRKGSGIVFDDTIGPVLGFCCFLALLILLASYIDCCFQKK